MPELLADRADDLDVDRFGEAGQLVERIRRAPRLSLRLDRDQERLLRSGLGRCVARGAGLLRLERLAGIVNFFQIELVVVVVSVG